MRRRLLRWSLVLSVILAVIGVFTAGIYRLFVYCPVFVGEGSLFLSFQRLRPIFS